LAVAEHFLEASEKRRTDTPNQRGLGWNILVELFKCVLNGTGDSGFWVGQRSVEIEKYGSHAANSYTGEVPEQTVPRSLGMEQVEGGSESRKNPFDLSKNHRSSYHRTKLRERLGHAGYTLE
jgi:hypothetical protein